MAFAFKKSVLSSAYLIEPSVQADDRGFFFRTYCKSEFQQAGLDKEWVQVNHSFTNKAGTIRGMHYQLPPHAETKLVRCIAGRVWDVIIDLRKDSPTFLQWQGAELSAENKMMWYIPEGFAHGFQALTDHCALIYQHSVFYVKGSEGGIRWNDPAINIHWPLPPVHISERDREHPLIEAHFSGIKL